MIRKIIAMLAAVMIAVIPAAALAEPEESESAQRTAEPPETALMEAPGASADPVPEASPSQNAEPTEDPSAAPAAGLVHIDLRVQGAGTLTLADGSCIAADGNSVDVEPGTVLTFEASALNGSEYVQAVYSGGYLEVARGPENTQQLSLTAAESGYVEVTFAAKKLPQHEIRIATSGAVALSYSTGAGETPVKAGETLTFPEGTAVLFRAVPLQGSSFEGCSFNDRALVAARENDAWTMELSVRESGTLAVRATSACTVSTILSEVQLRYDNGGTWQTVKEGDNVLSLPAGSTAYFSAVPAEGCSLSSLLVNGAPVTNVRTAGGEHRFSVSSIHGAIVITAVAEPRTASIQGIDSKTGIRYILPGTQEEEGSNITQDSWISVIQVTRGAAFERACLDAEPYGSLLSVYDLTLHNETGTYEPSVPISVSFPIPASFTGGSLKVLHAAEHGITEVPYRTEDIQGTACVTIAAEAFSLYMLVDAPPEDVPAVLAETGTPGTNGMSWALPVLILAVCLTLLAIFFRKRQAAH